MNDTKIASKAKAQLAHFMGKVFAAPPDGAAVSCGPKGPFVSGGAAWPDRAQ